MGVSRTVTPEFLASLEAGYGRIRQHHPELPTVLVLAETPHPAVKHRLAHFSSEECVTSSGVYQGRIVFMYPGLHRACPCVFDDGAQSTFTTLMHEAVHALASVRGIRDTSRDGSYHNKRFFELADELGLVPAGGKRNERGKVEMTPATARRYAASVARIAGHLPQRRPELALSEPIADRVSG